MFVVFHTEFPHQDKRFFKTPAGAKRSATCSNRNAGKLTPFLPVDVLVSRARPRTRSLA